DTMSASATSMPNGLRPRRMARDASRRRRRLPSTTTSRQNGQVSSETVTIVDDGRVAEVPGAIRADGIRLSADAVQRSLGWELKRRGLCGGDPGTPAPADPALAGTGGIDLRTLAAALGRPLAVDLEERIAWLGASAGERGTRLRSLEAPDFELPDIDG